MKNRIRELTTRGNKWSNQEREEKLRSYARGWINYYRYADMKSLMEQGLLPMIGGNSSANAEEESCIYLCKRKDVGYWKIILQCPVVLQVSGISPDECEHFEYSYYGEYLCRKAISPKQIKKLHIEATEKQMKDLCLSFLYSASLLLVKICRHYEYIAANESA